MSIELGDHQIEALKKMKNGCILCGSGGTGKSRTALAYYYIRECGGSLKINGEGETTEMADPKDLYIITTAKKRDDMDWLDECAPFMLTSNKSVNVNGVALVVDSWNNIKKYVGVMRAFFIFDEQRVVGSGAWAKSFLKITRSNRWILLSATPGDDWSDYISVFIANGFYRNRTEFLARHAVYSRYVNHKIDRYVDTGVLTAYRNKILVPMRYKRSTVPHHNTVPVTYNKAAYTTVWRDRWDEENNEPIRETGRLFYLMRKVVNSDISRAYAVRQIINRHGKVIIFYNFTYELDILRRLADEEKFDIGEWNGEVHSSVPTSNRWVYLVQYSAGCEGWNCVSTNAMLFYSLSYSYRMMAQAEWRIDRLNTSYTELYYYILRSPAPIDLAIARALKDKKNFNENAFLCAQ